MKEKKNYSNVNSTVRDRDETHLAPIRSESLMENSALTRGLGRRDKGEEKERESQRGWKERYRWIERRGRTEKRVRDPHKMGSRFSFLPYGDRQPYRCESPYTAAVCKGRKGEKREEEGGGRR